MLATFCKIGKLPVTRLVSLNQTYTVGDTCVLRAMPNAGYTFLNWTENGNQISKDVEYSFAVTSNCQIEANFIKVPTGAIKGLFTRSLFPCRSTGTPENEPPLGLAAKRSGMRLEAR